MGISKAWKFKPDRSLDSPGPGLPGSGGSDGFSFCCFSILFDMSCQKISKLLARSLFEINAKCCSPDRWSVALSWVCYPVLRNSVLALVWQRAYFSK